MRTPPKSRRYWEDRLLQEFIESQHALEAASEKMKRLYEIVQAAPGTPDGRLALEQARAALDAAHERCRKALQAFNDVILYGKKPEGGEF